MQLSSHKSAILFCCSVLLVKRALISKSESDLRLKRYDCAIDILNNIHLAAVRLAQMVGVVVIIISHCNNEIETDTPCVLEWFLLGAADWNVITGTIDSIALQCNYKLARKLFATWFSMAKPSEMPKPLLCALFHWARAREPAVLSWFGCEIIGVWKWMLVASFLLLIAQV